MAKLSHNVGQSEKGLMEQIVQLAKLRGWLVYHTFDSRRSTAGFPDLVMVRRGRLIFCETKSQRVTYHSDPEKVIRDKARDRWFQERGFRVLRFSTPEILGDAKACVRQINRAIGA